MKTKGFTLVETLVAVTILVLSITAPLYSAGRSLATARNASNQLTASYLAQEGIEYVRMMRDNEFLKYYGTATNYWNKFKSGLQGSEAWTVSFCKGSSGFKCALATIDTGVSTLVQKAVGVDVFTDAAFAVSLPGSATTFYRIIQVTDQSNEEKITSTVQWEYKGTTYNVTTTAHLTPWQ